jgi:hypothetical protein
MLCVVSTRNGMIEKWMTNVLPFMWSQWLQLDWGGSCV